MKPQTLTGFERFGKTTRRAQFLADMDRVIPWAELAAAVETVYPKVSEAGGRPPIPLERMLRVYFLQLWFNLSDPAIEEAVYDSVAMRNFAGIDLGMEGAPDETTVCKFRHLLERNKLGKTLLRAVKEDMADIARARVLRQSTMRNIRQNMALVFVYNILGVPIAARFLYPAFGLLLSPIVAAAAMSLSSVSVISNALWLRLLHI